MEIYRRKLVQIQFIAGRSIIIFIYDESYQFGVDRSNIDTDVKPSWWPLDTWPLLPLGLDPVAGVDMGLDLKVQITDIHRVD